MDSLERKRKLKILLIHLILILVSLTMLVPFFWMILTSFKSITEATSVNPFVIFPKKWRTDAFRTVFQNMNFLLLYRNTLLLIFFVCFVQSSRQRLPAMLSQDSIFREETLPFLLFSFK